jgi:FHA domain/Bacterial regulatory protein, Fis family
MAQFILVYTHPREGEKRFDLVADRSYRIGSRPDNDILIDQKDVSRRHAVVRVDDGTFHITDLDSKNGTFINGAKTASGTFNCGDMVHLSSARLVIVELGTGSYPKGPEAILRNDDDSETRRTEETQKFRGEASMEDVVSLLETTANAVRRGALAEPLGWAVEHLGFDGTVVLYRDENDGVAMVSSAGDLGKLARKSGTLTKLATDHKQTSAGGTRVRQVSELDDNLLVATVGADHVLVVRYTGQPPAISDIRSVIASVAIVLGCGKVLRPGRTADSSESIGTARSTVATDAIPISEFGPDAEKSDGSAAVGDVNALDLELLAGKELAEARESFEEWMIRRALAASGGKQTEAAERLGLSRAGLFKKMRKMGL